MISLIERLENFLKPNALKIGILTFHRCINYGSYWQARCLVEGLRAQGYDAEILDHQSRKINVAEWKCAYQPVLPTAVPTTDLPLYREKIKGFFRAFESLPMSPSFPIDQPGEMECYDSIIVGSDEVWNLFHPWYGKQPLFYGDGLKADRLISYAASFGNYHSSWGLEKAWAERLNNFDAISVRDENSYNIIKSNLGIEPEMVLDPSLQFAIEPEERDLNLLRPYVAVYGHNFSNSFITEIRKWATHRNLLLISIGYRNDWADKQWISADPHEFAHFIAQSKCVVTNFFHGCVFALSNKKPFVCETSPYRSNKLQGLMVKVGAEKHLVWEDTPFTVYNERLDAPLDAEIFHKIEQLREASNEYLSRSLFMQQSERA